MEVTGPLQAEIYLSASCRDLDLWTRFLDVAPDGTAFNLMSPGLDVLRASYHEGKQEPEYLEPGGVAHLKLDRMLTSNTFLAGHRIRVQISGAFFPHFSRNLQTGSSETTDSRLLPVHDSHFSQQEAPIPNCFADYSALEGFDRFGCRAPGLISTLDGFAPRPIVAARPPEIVFCLSSFAAQVLDCRCLHVQLPRAPFP